MCHIPLPPNESNEVSPQVMIDMNHESGSMNHYCSIRFFIRNLAQGLVPKGIYFSTSNDQIVVPDDCNTLKSSILPLILAVTYKLFKYLGILNVGSS